MDYICGAVSTNVNDIPDATVFKGILTLYSVKGHTSVNSLRHCKVP